MEYILLITGIAIGALVIKIIESKRFSKAEQERIILEKECENLVAQTHALSCQTQEIKNNLDSKLAEIMRLREENSAFRTQITSLTENEKRVKEGMKENEIQLKNIFENIASKILEEKTDKFTRYNQEQVKQILEPLGKDIESFRKKVETVYMDETRERASLGKELQNLMELNRRLSDEASSLAKAIKGEHNPKIQGDWGEMILDSILSNSGLEKGVHYFPQESNKNEEGKILRPDVIVRYPDGRDIIIDSKVSLTAYSRYIAATDETERKQAIADHLASVKRHIDSLAGKNYDYLNNSIDFVMMFMPIEPAYMLALSSDSQIWEYAYKKKILIVSPTHLITALKLIYDLWSRDAQNRNAIDIANRGAQMYEKFAGFITDMLAIGKNIDNSKKAYDTAMNKLSEGKGNLVRQAEMLKELGIRSSKELGIASKNDSEQIGS